MVPSSHSATEAVDGTAQAPVYYLQSQNGNLGGELEPLVADVGTDGPAWASGVFGQPAEVANVWIGDSRSVTSLHKGEQCLHPVAKNGQQRVAPPARVPDHTAIP